MKVIEQQQMQSFLTSPEQQQMQTILLTSLTNSYCRQYSDLSLDVWRFPRKVYSVPGRGNIMQVRVADAKMNVQKQTYENDPIPQ